MAVTYPLRDLVARARQGHELADGVFLMGG